VLIEEKEILVVTDDVLLMPEDNNLVIDIYAGGREKNFTQCFRGCYWHGAGDNRS